MVSLFGRWDYGKVVPHLVIAGYRKDVEKCIQLIKEVLMESQKPWKMVESKEEYEFLKGNKEQEAIFAQYLKLLVIKIYRNR